jgi:hypothetical protein
MWESRLECIGNSLATLNFNRLHFYCHISQIDVRQFSITTDENTAEEAKLLPKISFVVVKLVLFAQCLAYSRDKMTLIDPFSREVRI